MWSPSRKHNTEVEKHGTCEVCPEPRTTLRCLLLSQADAKSRYGGTLRHLPNQPDIHYCHFGTTVPRTPRFRLSLSKKLRTVGGSLATEHRKDTYDAHRKPAAT